MKFDSINKKFSDYEIERGNEQGVEYIAILKNGFREPIKVYYESDMQEYIVTFATQHLHISEDEDLIDIVSKFADQALPPLSFTRMGKIALEDKSKPIFLKICLMILYEYILDTHISILVKRHFAFMRGIKNTVLRAHLLNRHQIPLK